MMDEWAAVTMLMTTITQISSTYNNNGVNIFSGAPLRVQGSTFSVGCSAFSRAHSDVAYVYVAI